LIQKKLHYRYRCCRQDKLMCERCEEKDEIVVYYCYAGLSEIVFPIKIKKKLVGYGILGQFRTGQGLPETIIQDWAKAGFAPEELREVYEAQPFYHKPAMDNMLRLFSMLIAFIVTQEYVRIRRPGVTEQVIHWLDEHIAEPLSLDDAAAAAKCSRSTVSHVIKRQLGMNFKKVCLLKKIQRFESLIAADPVMSIQEAAALVGYGDPFYFSRLYKKVRLAAPSTYVNWARKQAHE
jgi:AraC-like DNA-binding protein/ligand-binding sensor protein